jgi:long-chain acyl-CoA synthetase
MATIESRPWQRHYGAVAASLDYPAVTLYEALYARARAVPSAAALDFAGRCTPYATLVEAVDRCAAGLAALGLVAGERVAIAMPTVPQGVIAFYAALKLGAAASMIHPLSTRAEIEFILRAAGARFAITLDVFAPNFLGLWNTTPLEHLVLARMADALPPLQAMAYRLTRGRSIPRVAPDAHVSGWSDLVDPRHRPAPAAPQATTDVAAILYSGGTTGKPKGILLSHRNFIACAKQVATWGNISPGDSVLAIMPLFHGFGLGVCVNAVLMGGGRCILVPQFTAREVARLIRRKRPNVVVGVPTLFAALTREPDFMRADLSCLKAAFSGADTLPRSVKDRFEQLVQERGGSVRLLEGYGLTEAVTACMAMPLHEYREGSIGLPFPDVLAQICTPGTIEELPAGEQGEICVSGPQVMLGYMDAPDDNAATLRVHGDGRTWLHTGDLGRMDADGFFYFVCRLKRMIKSSGFNVYPAQVEEVLYRHSAVLEACVVGVPDELQVERVKAFVVVRPPAVAGDALAAELIAHCRGELIKWSCPREIEFCAALPRTRVGKVDVVALRATPSGATAASGGAAGS